MKDELLHKVATTLSEKIETEMQALYLLVEIRKLMDRENYVDSVIRSFSNWAVHIELKEEREGTTDLLQEFDEVIRLQVEENRGSLWPPHCSFETFRRNLDIFLHIYDLPTRLVDSEKSWIQFARLYSAIVSECPIRWTASKLPLKYVQEVELKKPENTYDGPRTEFLEWKVTLKDGTVQHQSFVLM